MTHSGEEPVKAITVALDQLIAVLRREQSVRLASRLHHQLHQVAWSNHSELLSELARLLRTAQSSFIPSYSEKASQRIEKILLAIDSVV